MVFGLEKGVRNTRAQENAKHMPGILCQSSALCLRSAAKTERNLLFGNKGIVGKKGKKFGLHCRATGGGGQHTKSDLTQLQFLLFSLSHTLWFYPTLNWPLVSYPFLSCHFTLCVLLYVRSLFLFPILFRSNSIIILNKDTLHLPNTLINKECILFFVFKRLISISSSFMYFCSLSI